MITSSTCSGFSAALSNADLITSAPSSTELTSLSEPPNVPTAVLTALTITASLTKHPSIVEVYLN